MDLVIELQNSAISPDEIETREAFYGRMVWVVNAKPFSERFFLMKQKNGCFTFKWKHMKKAWLTAKKPVYFDFGDTTVDSLLGAKFSTSESYFDRDGNEGWSDRSQIIRYAGPYAWDDYEHIADESIENLESGVRSSSILRRNTLHDSGLGSAFVMDRDALIRSLSLSEARAWDLSAFD